MAFFDIALGAAVVFFWSFDKGASARHLVDSVCNQDYNTPLGYVESGNWEENVNDEQKSPAMTAEAQRNFFGGLWHGAFLALGMALTRPTTVIAPLWPT